MRHAESQEAQALLTTTTAGDAAAEARAAVVVARGQKVQPAAGLDTRGDRGARCLRRFADSGSEKKGEVK